MRDERVPDHPCDELVAPSRGVLILVEVLAALTVRTQPPKRGREIDEGCPALPSDGSLTWLACPQNDRCDGYVSSTTRGQDGNSVEMLPLQQPSSGPHYARSLSSPRLEGFSGTLTGCSRAWSRGPRSIFLGPAREDGRLKGACS